MGVPDVISYFDGFEGENEWAALSNFYQGEPIPFGPYVFPTGEHFYQGLKATTREEIRKILSYATPGEAKAWGKHTLRLRGDWERVKYDAMRLVLAHKFRPGREEHGVLLATGDALLVEGNTWGDPTWGVDLKAGRAKRAQDAPWEPGQPWQLSPGRNWLGALLMARRAELLAEAVGARFSYESVAEFVRYTPPVAG